MVYKFSSIKNENSSKQQEITWRNSGS